MRCALLACVQMSATSFEHRDRNHDKSLNDQSHSLHDETRHGQESRRGGGVLLSRVSLPRPHEMDARRGRNTLLDL